MANYSSWDNQFQNCLNGNNPANVCIPHPSSFNPYNVTSLANFKIGMLVEILSNSLFGKKLGVCYEAVKILPLTFAVINATRADPQSLNIPILSLHSLANITFPFEPSRLNESNPAQIMTWWWDIVENDTTGASNFIYTLEKNCTKAFCTSIPSYGDPDISGIGMLISTGMLIFLAILFAIPAFFGWKSRRQNVNQRPYPSTDLSKGRRLRHALIGTLDDLISAVIIFTLSVNIAALIIRAKNTALYDIFMAETLSLISSSAMAMIATAYWASYRHVGRLRPSVLLGFVVDAVLTITLFGFEFHDKELEGIPLEQNCLKTALGGTQWDNPGGRIWVLPLCFALWLCALLASLTQLPWIRAKTPRTRFFSNMSYAIGLVPIVLCTVSLVLLCRMFYVAYGNMKTAFGTAFTDPEQNWTFGQFLALATWAPPFLQFFHLLLVGMKNVLRTRMPEPWDVFVPESKEVDRRQTV